MIRTFLLGGFVFCTLSLLAQTNRPNQGNQSYHPTPENISARKQFQENRFGLFIHWGVSSMLGAGEWVMQNRNIKVKDYVRLRETFTLVSLVQQNGLVLLKMRA